jgi:sugar phosphate permease
VSRYRWVVLGAGVVAQAASAAVLQGLPGLAPRLREEFALSLTGLGVLLASVTFGLVATLVLWGALADRVGERIVMTSGLLLAAGALVAATTVTTVGPLMGCLVVAGAAGASVNAASGRAVIGWFEPAQRGFAMGVRQTALPVGAGTAAAVLPPLAAVRGLDAAFVAMAVACLVSAAVVALVVVYLVDEHDVAVATAALLLAAVQFGGGAARIAAGRWSDRLGQRVVPLRRLARVITGLFALVALLAATGAPVVVPVLLVAGVVAISWNGLAFTAVGELAGPGRAGTALGLQNTAVALGAAATAPLLAAVVERTSWAIGFGLAATAGLTAALLLGPLVRGERPRLSVAPDGPLC